MSVVLFLSFDEHLLTIEKHELSRCQLCHDWCRRRLSLQIDSMPTLDFQWMKAVVRCEVDWSNFFMMTSSNGNIFRVTGPLCGEFTGLRSFDVFFDLRLIKRLNKHSRGWWFETLSSPLWRYRNVRKLMTNMITYNVVKGGQIDAFSLL